MENKVLEENLEIIKKYDSTLADKILMFECEKSNIELCQTQKGEYNISYKGYCLHSQQSAQLEAEAIANCFQDEENEIKVIFGLGLGYVVDELSKKIQKTKLIVYEKELEILKFVLSIAKIDALEKENVILCNDKKTLKNYVKNYTNKDSVMKLVYTKTYKKIFADDFEEVSKTVQKAQGQHSANINTVLIKAPLALRYTYSNLDKILNLPYIGQFKDFYKGKTALIVSAGPSLKNEIENIKKYRNKFIIFCVNITMRYLIEQGIKPDFVGDVETFGDNYQYKDLDLSDTCLILESFSNELKFEVKPKQIISYISANNFINPWIRDLMNIEDNLETMGTVSYALLESARIMGFQKIILVGQDLAYSNGQCYSKGSLYGDLECIFDEEEKKYKIITKDFENFLIKFAGSDTPENRKKAQKQIEGLNKVIFTVKGQNGSYLPTQNGYALFVDFFEDAAEAYLKENPNLELINSSKGGAQIDGFKNIELEKAVRDNPDIERKEINIKNIEYDKEYCISKIQEHIENIKGFQALAKELKMYCKKFLQETYIKKNQTQNSINCMKKHNELLKEMLKYYFPFGTRIYIHRFTHKIIELIEKDFTKNLYTIKTTYEELLKIYEEIDSFSDFAVEKLTYCQSVVLQ